MVIKWSLILALLFLGFLYGFVTDKTSEKIIPIATIAKREATGGGPTHPTIMVISQANERLKLKNLNFFMQGDVLDEIDKIDLDKYSVVVVLRGMRYTSGFGITIERILQKEKEITIIVSLKDPLPGEIVAEATHIAYHIVKVAKSELTLNGTSFFVLKDIDGNVLATHAYTFQHY